MKTNKKLIFFRIKITSCFKFRKNNIVEAKRNHKAKF